MPVCNLDVIALCRVRYRILSDYLSTPAPGGGAASSTLVVVHPLAAHVGKVCTHADVATCPRPFVLIAGGVLMPDDLCSPLKAAQPFCPCIFHCCPVHGPV